MYDSVFTPIKTTVGPAPDISLKFIHCNCKTKSKNTYIQWRVPVEKNGLQCVSACTDCRRQHCENRDVDINLEDIGKERNIFNLRHFIKYSIRFVQKFTRNYVRFQL